MTRGASGTVVALVVMTVAMCAGGYASQRWPAEPSVVAQVLAAAPADVRSIDITDWGALRAEFGDADSTLAKAVSGDLAARSVLWDSTELLQELYGWSAATVEWEAHLQTPRVGVILVGLPDAMSSGQADDRLRSLGYTADAGLWSIDSGALRSTGLTSVESYTNARVMDGVMILSDAASSVETVADVIDGHRRSALSDTGLAALGRSLDGHDSVLLQRGDTGCESTDPAVAGPDVAAQAANAVTPIGVLRPYRWLARALDANASGTNVGSRFVVSMVFDSAGRAAEQLQTRRQLTAGPFIGQTGQVADSLILEDARSDGPVAALEFTRPPKAVALMAATGPLFFAACG